MNMQTVNYIAVPNSDRVAMATDALSAVKDLCVSAAHKTNDTLDHVDADHFASLLRLIIVEIREAIDDV